MQPDKFDKSAIKHTIIERFLSNRWWWLYPIFTSLGFVIWSYLISSASITEHSIQIAQKTARNMFNMIVLTRAWNAGHGGVYVPITEHIQANPYLDVPHRDIVTTDNIKLTLINPAYMTRQLAELAQKSDATKFHITSLAPIRPANKADEWETQALLKFELGVEEISERISSKNSDEYRYMAPLIVKQGCLKCHQKQGYNLGDIRGGISVSLQAQAIFGHDKKHIEQSKRLHSVIFVLLTGLMLLFFETMRRQWLLLKNVEQHQEQLIRERTQSLQTSNQNLSKEIEIRKSAEQAIEEAKNKAELATKAKSEFLANMSHEIRTPMSGVLGMTHFALQTDLNAKQKSFISKAHDSAESLMGILNDILDYSKIEAGKLTIEKKSFDLSQTVNNIINLLEYKASEKGLVLTLNYDNNAGRYFLGDSMRISQILTNLIGNAIKFTLEGEIIVNIYKNRGNKLHFEVKDSGIGLTQAQQKMLFQAFSQADTSNTRKFGGTGLGLIISKQLVELMAGNIWVESEIDVGSNFIFEIELTESKLLPEESSSLDKTALESQLKEQLKDSSTYNILLVEDSDILQSIILEILNNFEINIDLAINGIEAVNLYQQQPDKYQLILMDLQMPEMDGYEACKIIRSSDKKIPIVALTANVMIEDIEKTRQAGMNAHLAKPIKLAKLYTILLTYLSKGQPDTSVLDSAEETIKLSKVESIVKPEKNNLQYDKKLFAGLYGINTQQGLELVNNNLDLYIKMLNLYRSNYLDVSARLRQLQQAGSFSDLKKYTHKLKGNSANLGIELVQSLASKLEQACANKGDNIMLLIEELEHEMNKLIPAISSISNYQSNTPIDVQGDASGKQVNKSQVNELCLQILENLDKDIDKVDELMHSLLSLYSGLSVPENIKQLNELLFNFETDQARNLISKIIA